MNRAERPREPRKSHLIYFSDCKVVWPCRWQHDFGRRCHISIRFIYIFCFPKWQNFFNKKKKMWKNWMRWMSIDRRHLYREKRKTSRTKLNDTRARIKNQSFLVLCEANIIIKYLMSTAIRRRRHFSRLCIFYFSVCRNPIGRSSSIMKTKRWRYFTVQNHWGSSVATTFSTSALPTNAITINESQNVQTSRTRTLAHPMRTFKSIINETVGRMHECE